MRKVLEQHDLEGEISSEDCDDIEEDDEDVVELRGKIFVYEQYVKSVERARESNRRLFRDLVVIAAIGLMVFAIYKWG